MKKKIVIPYCKKCPRIQLLGTWVIPTTGVRRYIQEERLVNRVISYTQTICPECQGVLVCG